MVSVNVQSSTLEEALAQMVRQTDVIYQMRGANIVLSRRQQTNGKTSTVPGVIHNAQGSPTIGVSVMVKGTTVGTFTDINGAFTLQVPAPASTAVLVVSFLGHEKQEISVGSRTQFNISLREEGISLERVVVTALGIKRSEKALSYNAQQVGSDEILTNKDVNFINALNGKVAGVTINASSAGVGAASKVLMRGEKSILQSSNALYVIDGVPMFAPTSRAGTEFDSKGVSEPIADINPEDIESISVLNGAAAAALYGSDATNGCPSSKESLPL